MKEQPMVVRLIRGFAMFWWDFLVGDTPEITVAVVAIIGVTALLSESHHENTAAIVALPLLAVVALGASVQRARRAARKKRP